MLYNTERPYTFDDFVGQQHIVKGIRSQAIKKKWFNVYVFGGQFGGGKTSMARIVSLASNCNHLDERGNPCLCCDNCKSIINGTAPDIIEIDGASNNGVESIRSLRDTVSYVPMELKQKVYIIDEVHMLSKGAFNALLKVLEEPPAYVSFILCTTEVNSIPTTIRSRAANYTFEQISHEDIIGRLEKVTEKYKIKAELDALTLIAKYSEGALRNALSILDQVSSMEDTVTEENVRSILGVTSNENIFRLCEAILKSNTVNCIDIIEKLNAQGRNFFLLCNDMIEIITDTLVCSIGGIDAVKDTEQYKKDILSIVQVSTSEQLCVVADELHQLRDSLRKAPGKTTIIVGIIRLTTDISSSFSALMNRISELEKQVQGLIERPVHRISNKACEEVEEDRKNEVVVHEEMVMGDENEDSTTKQNEIYEWNTNSTENLQVANSYSLTVELEELNVASSVVVEDELIPEPEAKNDLETSEMESQVLTTETTKEEQVKVDNVETEKIVINETQENDDMMEKEFDVFDFLNDLYVFGEKSDAKKNEDVKDIPKPEVKTDSSEKAKEGLALLEKLSKEDEIMRVALIGCKVENDGTIINLKTSLPPVANILTAYLESYKMRGYMTEIIRVSLIQVVRG